jgi:hypothetical protein
MLMGYFFVFNYVKTVKQSINMSPGVETCVLYLNVYCLVAVQLVRSIECVCCKRLLLRFFVTHWGLVLACESVDDVKNSCTEVKPSP